MQAPSLVVSPNVSIEIPGQLSYPCSALTIDLKEHQLVIVREIGDRRGEAIASWNLGYEYAKQGELAQAIANMQVLVKYEQELGHPSAKAHAQRVNELRARLKTSS